MKKRDIIGLEVEIISTEIIAFLVISGASCFYSFKINDSILSTILLVSFIMASYKVIANILKLNNLAKELK